MLYTWNRQAKAAMATRILHLHGWRLTDLAFIGISYGDFIWGSGRGWNKLGGDSIGDVDVLLIMENLEMGLKNGKFNGI